MCVRSISHGQSCVPAKENLHNISPGLDSRETEHKVSKCTHRHFSYNIPWESSWCKILRKSGLWMIRLCVSSGLAYPKGQDGIAMFGSSELYSPRNMWRGWSGVECTVLIKSFLTCHTALAKQAEYSLPPSHQTLAVDISWLLDHWLKNNKDFFRVFVGEMCMFLTYNKVLPLWKGLEWCTSVFSCGLGWKLRSRGFFFSIWLTKLSDRVEG